MKMFNVNKQTLTRIIFAVVVLVAAWLMYSCSYVKDSVVIEESTPVEAIEEVKEVITEEPATPVEESTPVVEEVVTEPATEPIVEPEVELEVSPDVPSDTTKVSE